jgi:long-chain acyl-CoA synthetase
MSARTVYTMLEETAAAHADKPALQQPIGGGKYRTYTWAEVRDRVQWVAVGLSTIGVETGHMVALQSETRAEFYFADLGVMAAGAVAAALYTSLPYAEQAQALRFCEARVAMVENPKAMLGLRTALAALPGAAQESAPDLQWVLLTGAAEGAITLDQLIEKGQRQLAADPHSFERIRACFDDQALAVLYMTSGATGEPKMGLVTHAALVINVDMTPAVLPLTPDDCTVVFLPSAHIAQRVVGELMPVRTGSCIWFSEGLSKLPHELRTARPTFFLSPPRVWERMYSSILAEIKKRPAPLRKLFYLALGMGSRAAQLRRDGRGVPAWIRSSLRLFDKIIFNKIRERLGGRLRFPVSGAAPLSKDLAEFYEAIGMPLLEGYGLTEGGVVSVNPYDRVKPGSIGKLLPGIEVRIEEDGELLLRSDVNFTGYYKDPAATAAVLRDGWLYTGDIATCDDEGYYYITGRKKELIVSSNGKKIYPARIEGLFKKEPLINHVLLIGDRLPYVTAIITVTGDPAAAQSIVASAVKNVNRQLASFEQIRKFKILDRDFSIEHGELTPTMKLRRSRALENHRALVSELYAGREFE